MTPQINSPSQARGMADALCSHVLVNLTVRQDADYAHVMAILHDEMAATAQLYLNGKIQQWFSKIDERGVMFLFSTTTVDATRALMADLPLVKANLVDLQFTRLGPLQPMRTLLGKG